MLTQYWPSLKPVHVRGSVLPPQPLLCAPVLCRLQSTALSGTVTSHAQHIHAADPTVAGEQNVVDKSGGLDTVGTREVLHEAHECDFMGLPGRPMRGAPSGCPTPFFWQTLFFCTMAVPLTAALLLWLICSFILTAEGSNGADFPSAMHPLSVKNPVDAGYAAISRSGTYTAVSSFRPALRFWPEPNRCDSQRPGLGHPERSEQTAIERSQRGF